MLKIFFEKMLQKNLTFSLSIHPGKLLFNLSGEYIIMKTVICKGKCNYYGE